jgi:hypothetical protein
MCRRMLLVAALISLTAAAAAQREREPSWRQSALAREARDPVIPLGRAPCQPKRDRRAKPGDDD